MGLAASQTRMLALTSRKSNVEFQGQQINQQRTTLANETSTYNSQLLDLKVPTAPSSADYTRTTYTFNANAQTCTITGFEYDNTAGSYTVNYTYDTRADKKASGSALYAAITDASGNETGYRTAAGTILSLVDYAADADATEDEIAAAVVDRSNLQMIFGDNYQAADNYYKYTVNGVIRYVKEDNLTGMTAGTNTPYYYVDQDADVTNSARIEKANVQWNDSGRATTVSFTGANGETIEYTLSTTTSTDERAYNDAMNQYEYDKQVYEQELNKINSKMSVVQSQDKRLEIQLTQLDTEQKAISTEIDAVNKVIEKNTETSFKTFA